MPFPIICLIGPTASGKTALAMAMIESGLPLEIVSVDSAMIYRDMNIGTAKPTQAELALAPHHLIDIRNPTEYYSAGNFLSDANTLIKTIRARGRIPLLVGGTMLYFKALQKGLAEMPPQNPDIRADIIEEAKTKGWPALYAKLAEIDPNAASKIKATDPQRIQRALEVFYLTGKPLSSFHAQKNSVSTLCFKNFAFFPQDRSILHLRIKIRVEAMLDQGLMEEVISLRQKYSLEASLPAMRSVGYRQVWDYLEGKIPQNELRDRILYATRQYAKRQMTWLKSWQNISCFDLNEDKKMKEAIFAEIDAIQLA